MPARPAAQSPEHGSHLPSLPMTFEIIPTLGLEVRDNNFPRRPKAPLGGRYLEPQLCQRWLSRTSTAGAGYCTAVRRPGRLARATAWRRSLVGHVNASVSDETTSTNAPMKMPASDQNWLGNSRIKVSSV